jgi:hypothetical protein
MALTKESAKSQNTVVDILNAGDVEIVRMRVHARGEENILKRLTDQYRDTIASTVREVVSNAIDATILLPEGDRTSVEITTPSELSPNFIIRDHGVGMSTETVKEIYSQYGASTKLDDMRQIGAFGLGAKAPLAYCSEFTVVTIKNGIQTVFTVSRGGGGNFAKIISPTETSEPNGTVVTIPVAPDDARRFANALITYKKFSFDVSIVIDGDEFQSNDYVLLTSEFPLEADGNTVGRLWVRRDSFVQLMKNKINPQKVGYGIGISTGYVLSGWCYGYDEPLPGVGATVIVELKPGVVDFPSSRDEITVNDRSNALAAQVSSYLANSSEESIDQLLEIYRGFDNDYAYKVVAQLLIAGNRKHSYNYSYRQNPPKLSAADAGRLTTIDLSPEVQIPVAKLTTNSGYNPLALITNVYPVNSYGTICSTGEGAKGFYSAASRNYYNFLDYISSRFTTDKVSDINLTLKTAVSANRKNFSVADLLLRSVFFNNTNYHPYRRQGNIKHVVVTGVTPVNVHKLLAARTAYADQNGVSFEWILVDNSPSVQEQIDLVIKELSIEVSFAKAEDIIAAGRKFRTKTKQASTVDRQTMHLNLLTTGLSKPSKLKDLSYHTSKAKDITPAELMKENAVLLLSHTDIKYVLMGAVNNGFDLCNRPIYFTHQSKGVWSVHLEELGGYKGVIAAHDYNATSEIAKSVKRNKKFYSTVLLSELDDVPKDEIIVSYFHDNISLGKGFVPMFLSYLESKGNGGELHRVMSLYHESLKKLEYLRVRHSYRNEELVYAIEPDTVKLLTHLHKATWNIRANDTLTSKLLYETISCSVAIPYDPDDDVARTVFDKLYSQFSLQA